MRNAERYYDPTAGIALKNVEMEKRMEYKSGDVIMISRNGKEKAFVTLMGNGYVLTGCALFPSEQNDCVQILCRGKMWANPYRIEFVSLTSGDYDISYVRTAADAELEALKAAIAKAMTLPAVDAAKVETMDESPIEAAENQAKELIEARTEARVYRDMCDRLLEMVMA